MCLQSPQKNSERDASRPHENHRRRRAFTLIELLVVIGIIGILLVLLVPRVMSVIISARDATTKATYQQWARSLDQYKQKYGYYPNLGGSYNTNTDTEYNLDEGTMAENFVIALSGKKIDGTKADEKELEQMNPDGFEFCTFVNDNFKDKNPDTRKFVDHTGNTLVRVMLDTDGDGFLELKHKPEDVKPLHLNKDGKLKARIFISTLAADSKDGETYRDIYVFQ